MLIENSLFKENIPEKGIIDGHIQFKMARSDSETIGIVGFCANITGSVLFEQLQAQGTNIVFSLAEQGTVDVVARNQDDGLNLQWQPKDFEENRLDDIAERIKRTLAPEEKEVRKQPEEPEPSAEENEAHVKQLTRIP